MLEIALIRHGRTASNLRYSYTGATDDPLLEQYIGELTSRKYPDAQIVFSSPMRRGIETARLIYPNCEPIILEDLRERDFGDFEGLTHAEIIARPGYSGWGMDEEHMEFPNGEKLADFVDRCGTVFLKTVEIAGANMAERIAIICHGGVIMAILSLFAQPKRDYYLQICENGGGYALIYHLGVLTVNGGLGV